MSGDKDPIDKLLDDSASFWKLRNEDERRLAAIASHVRTLTFEETDRDERLDLYAHIMNDIDAHVRYVNMLALALERLRHGYKRILGRLAWKKR